MTTHTFKYQTEKSEFCEDIPHDVTSTCDEELTLDEVLQAFELHLKACGYTLPEGKRVGLVNEL